MVGCLLSFLRHIYMLATFPQLLDLVEFQEVQEEMDANS